MTAPQETRKPSTASTDSAVSPTTQQFPKQTRPQSAPAQPQNRAIQTQSSSQARGQDQDQAERKSSYSAGDRRFSDEWGPPSRFQKRKGSIYAVPASRDGRVDSNYQQKFFEKLAEMGYSGGKKQ
ncbi:e9090107-59ce-4766-b92a-d873606063e6 [Thermothielavioides terrestris]|uniref:E9090107-59ce-4766-b92a-d873606063e6 n=1 Tax=Thermothielavioides terrestris TaxID=2587410 RepID=A0A3S4AKM8_9PEZI|nr:e9090107-59ce-4766-b92a-d873606063e6 [Thermothielavioides terrestris]